MKKVGSGLSEVQRESGTAWIEPVEKLTVGLPGTTLLFAFAHERVAATPRQRWDWGIRWVC